MNKKILITAALFGFLSVGIGAFAAHGLKPLISEAAMRSFETGVRYQMYHAIVLLFIGGTSVLSAKTKTRLFYLIVIGVLLFSGSIYGLATNALSAFDFKAIGFITPIGGLFLISAWVVMFIEFLRIKSN